MRQSSLLEAGLSEPRVDALMAMEAGPYAVLLTGVAKNAVKACEQVLQELGYSAVEGRLAVERAQYISPETVAMDLGQSAAVSLARDLESSGGKVKIKEPGA